MRALTRDDIHTEPQIQQGLWQCQLARLSDQVQHRQDRQTDRQIAAQTDTDNPINDGQGGGQPRNTRANAFRAAYDEQP